MLIDAGSPDTWPDRVQAEVDAIGADLTAHRHIESKFASDLWRLDHDGSIGDRFLAAADGYRVACYHASRLLPHEVEAIAAQGMRVLSYDLVQTKAHDAARLRPDLIDQRTADAMMDMGPLNWQGNASGRLGLLWLVAPFGIFVAKGPGGFDGLLGSWGGEALGWLDGVTPDVASATARLTAASKPTIVAMAVDHYPSGLWTMFVGARLGLDLPHHEWTTTDDVPAEQVVGMIHPDDPTWPPSLGDPAARRRPRS